MSQPTDAEIAGKLTGMKCGGAGITNQVLGFLSIYLLNRPMDHVTLGPSDLLAFCRAVVERCDGKNKKLQKIFNALDNHLGDTDPDILEDATDDEIRDEEPVFWAANEIAKILKENK